MKKEWPEDRYEPARFDDITGPICEAIRCAYLLQRRTEVHETIPWTGLPLEGAMLAGCLQAQQKLNAENLKYSDEDQGRDPLCEIVGLAVQLGICQGIRSQRKKIKESTALSMFKILQQHLLEMNVSEIQDL